MCITGAGAARRRPGMAEPWRLRNADNSKVDMPVARFDAPLPDGPAVFNNHRLCIQRYGGTNVPGYAVPTVARLRVSGGIDFDDQMLLAMSERPCRGSVRKINARRRIFRRNRFMAKIQAQPPCARPADNASEHQGSMQKL